MIRDEFLQPFVEQGLWWELETRNGTEWVPGDLYSDPGVILFDGPYDRDNCAWFDDVAQGLQQYAEGEIESFKLIKGWGARLSAPGYLDCTSWCVFATEEEAKQHLKDEYEVGVEKTPSELTDQDKNVVLESIQDILYGEERNPNREFEVEDLDLIHEVLLKRGLAPEDF